MMSMSVLAVGLFFALYGVVFLGVLGMQLYSNPLFPFRLDDVGWTSSWLLVTTADYYGVSLVLTAMILCSEPLLRGIIFALCVNLLGCPFACLYLVYRIWSRGLQGLKLADHGDAYAAVRERL